MAKTLHDAFANIAELNRRLNTLHEVVQRLEWMARHPLVEMVIHDKVVSTPFTSWKPGDHVSYRPSTRKPALWAGRVIPQPAGERRSGKFGNFVWVMRDGDNAIRGIYPWNLV